MSYPALNYSRTTLGYVEATCVGITKYEWDKYMANAKRANKKEINRLVRRDLPELYEDLSLQFHNPYNYFKTPKHIILVHSAIEYFITYQQ